jgi:iron complex transport system ATP-binding protein
MAGMSRELLRFEQVSFGYGEQPVLNGLNMILKQGQCYCQMGRNGCGKSTLLNCILKRNTQMQGNIYIEEDNLTELTAKKLSQKIAFVPQSHQVTFPYLVKQVVLMGRTPQLSGMGGPASEDMELVMDSLEQLGIQYLAERPYTQISGGELKLVLLARAIVQDTPVILMDEPTAHLDFYNELLFLEKISELVLNKGKTILMATHAPNHAFQLASAGVPVQVGLMGEGKIFAEGAPEDILTEENIEQIFRIKGKILAWENQKVLIPQSTTKRD